MGAAAEMGPGHDFWQEIMNPAAVAAERTRNLKIKVVNLGRSRTTESRGSLVLACQGDAGEATGAMGIVLRRYSRHPSAKGL